MAALSGILAWETAWTKEPDGLQSIESQSQTCLSDYAITIKGRALETMHIYNWITVLLN